jgi:cell division protein FtsB
LNQNLGISFSGCLVLYLLFIYHLIIQSQGAEMKKEFQREDVSAHSDYSYLQKHEEMLF